MSFSYPGGIISSIENVPSTSPPYCSGVWKLSEAAYWRGQGQWPFGPSDPNFAYNSLLLNGDGTNGAQNNTFLDSSTNNFTITRNGNTTQGSFSPYGTLWSNNFNGSSMLTAASSSDWTLGTGDFTIEAWIFPTSLGTSNYPAIVSNQANFDSGYTNRFALILDNSGINWYNTAGNYAITSNSAPQLNVWTHVAIVRSSSTIKMYVNGVAQTQTQTSNQNYSTTNDLYIGGIPFTSTSARFFGYISNLRIVKGSAVYTSNFTPSTTPLTAVTNTTVLTCQSNRFVDNSSTGRAITVSTGTPSVQRFSPFNPTAPYSTSVIGGSGYFDGSGDWLATSSSSNQWAFGTGDFTVECWLYTGAATNRVIMANRAGSTGLSTHWSLEFFNTAQRVEWHTGLAIIASSNTNAQLNAWVHIAVVRSSGTMKIYQNGVEVASASDSSNYSDVNPLLIANEPVFPSGNNPFLGYISNIRIVKGTAVYTAAFTPPTAPVTAITNTSFLGNMTNAGIPDLAMQNNLETVGNAQVSTSVKKYGTGSLAFDGSGDVLSMPYRPMFNFSGDFTIECWLYMNSLSSIGTVWSQNSGGTFFILHTSVSGSNALGLYIDTLGAAPAIQSSALSTGTWYHVALTRSGSSFRLFLNGTQTGSTYTNSGNPTPSGTPSFFVGNNNASNGAPLNGYIDDLRITNGLARYTTTFTPPTAALPTY